ncbi:type II secretion system F family protein [Variovorax sp. YR752]|uniref:type II secretion system F family protein n=1 Tax=Variovorax sp. YR752 TaxID=1884383 RepID=UPI003138328D
MPTFEVRCLQADGVVSRRVEAPDAQAVAALLGLPPHQVLGVEPLRVANESSGSRRAERFPLRLFSKELSVLLAAGIPLLEAVVTLREKEDSPATAAALAAVEASLQAGESFSAALAVRPEAFDALFIAVVSSAERTGQLQDALRAHSDYLAWVETLRDRLVSASVYPLLLLYAGAAVVLFLLVYVVPRFAGLLDGVDGDVPAASRALLAIGQWTGTHPWSSAAIAVALMASPWAAWQQPLLRERLLGLAWSVPLLSARLRLLALARLYRTLSMLLAAGVPAVAALRTARGVIAPHLRASLDAATAGVEQGQRLSDALLAQGLTTPVSVRMVRVGERSGSVGAMFGEAAAFYDEELTRLTEVVTRLISPLLMLLMGGVIGTVVVLMYLPIFQLMESVQ